MAMLLTNLKSNLFKTVTLGMVIFMFTLYVLSVLAVLEAIFCLLTGKVYSLAFPRIWFVTEGIFILAVEIRYRVLMRHSSDHLPPITSERLEAAKKEFRMDHYVPEEFFKGWFFGCRYDDITTADLREWICAMFYHKHPDEISLSQKDEIESVLQEIVARAKIPPRSENYYNRKIKLTMDKPWLLIRPLTFYLAIRAVDYAGHLAFQHLGFELRQMGSVGLLMHHRPGKIKNKPPIVLFHGLGIGLCTYVPFVLGLIKEFGERDIILFEMTSVTMRLDDRFMLPEDFADHVALSLSFLIDRKAIFIGHSIGTACVRWIDMYHPELVHGRIFLDPICFALWNYDIAYNALYRRPKDAHECIINIVAMSEPGIAIFLHRYFLWFINTYFTHELPKNSRIYLSNDDDIVNTAQVYKYLNANTDPSREVQLLQNMRHGQMVFVPKESKLIYQGIKSIE